ncbi:MAG: DNA mismatch repair endonuclease MutL [candidate division Zixibacteria bacterium]|nr:DNA mismatch repair endonuclease MutL [candidate division Zixibacteria bacterium]
MDRLPAGQDSRSWIKPLPARVINKIAAGEVIERPAAVVKELVENAIDAGAERIDIIIEKSGVKLIKVVDNGCGIPEEQIEIAFARHATSKISNFNDLEDLITYGFRGEALPSVASVSRLRMVSRSREEKAGTEIIFEGGVLQSQEPFAAPVGTAIEVENLFFNTPARRKFLKAETTEASYISRIATAMAIARHQIGFSLTMNSRRVFNVPSGSGLKERVESILGNNRQFIAANGIAGPAQLEGYIGMPDNVRHNRSGQYIFINGRYVYSPVLSHAFQAGYGELIQPGTFPVGALLITVDPVDVDVNVHPSKTEVKLARERELHDAVKSLIRESLRKDGIIPSLRKSESHQQSSNHPSAGVQSPHQSNSETFIPGIGSGQAAGTRLLSELYRSDARSDTGGIQPEPEPEGMRVDKETGEVLRQQPAVEKLSTTDEHLGPSSGFRLIGRFADLYLLIQAGEDLYIVDQHTAHERVLYEEIRRHIESSSANGQNLLFPVQMELSPEQFSIFEESKEIFDRSGFSVSPFGGRVVRIEAVPAIIADKSPETILLKLLDDVASLRHSFLQIKTCLAQ